MRRHRFDILSFLSGLVFAGAGVAYLVNDASWRFDVGPWLWPILLLIGGAVILLSTLVDERRQRPAEATDAAPAGAELNLDGATEARSDDPTL